jgi:hypothetical protein
VVCFLYLLHHGRRDTGWPSDTTASCASTTSTLKSDIIEVWKGRKKKNHRKRSLEVPQEEAAAEAGPAKAGPTPVKAGLTG